MTEQQPTSNTPANQDRQGCETAGIVVSCTDCQGQDACEYERIADFYENHYGTHATNKPAVEQ